MPPAVHTTVAHKIECVMIEVWHNKRRISEPPFCSYPRNQTCGVAPLPLIVSEHTKIESYYQMDLDDKTHAQASIWSPFSSKGSSLPIHPLCLKSSSTASGLPRTNIHTVTDERIDNNQNSKRTKLWIDQPIKTSNRKVDWPFSAGFCSRSTVCFSAAWANTC